MKTLTEFRKRMQPGTRIKYTHHMKYAGRNKEDQPIFKDADPEMRTVLKCTASKIETQKDDGRVSYADMPKKSEVILRENSITFTVPDSRGFSGDINAQEHLMPRLPCFTYEFEG